MKAIILGYEDQDGNLEAALPLMPTRGLPLDIGAQQTGPRLCSLPRTPACGPLFTHETAAAQLLQAAVEKAENKRLRLQVKCNQQLPVENAAGLTGVHWRPTYVLSIPGRTEDLQFAGSRHRHKLKWAAEKASRNGVRIRAAESETDVWAWYKLYLQTMRRNAVPPRPLRFFLALGRELAPHGMQLQLAERNDRGKRRLAAGAIFLRFRESAWYAFSGSDPREMRLYPNDLLLWSFIHEACGSGLRRLDLGEVPEDHPELERFKTKWGALPRAQYRYLSNAAERSALRLEQAGGLRRMWRHLPLWLTTQLGDCIYRRL